MTRSDTRRKCTDEQLYEGVFSPFFREYSAHTHTHTHVANVRTRTDMCERDGADRKKKTRAVSRRRPGDSSEVAASAHFMGNAFHHRAFILFRDLLRQQRITAAYNVRA